MMTGMGYLVITYVETIDQARAMTKAIPEGVDGARIAGVYRMPSHDEPVCMGLSGGCKAVGWTRHPRGYMVHACGLRNPNYRDTLAVSLMDNFGINLLLRDRTPKVFRNPKGWDKK
jgi:hypothetical protein